MVFRSCAMSSWSPIALVPSYPVKKPCFVHLYYFPHGTAAEFCVEHADAGIVAPVAGAFVVAIAVGSRIRVAVHDIPQRLYGAAL